MLQRQRGGAGKTVHEAGDGGAFLGHGDEDFARTAVAVEADGDVALVAADVEFVGDRHALVVEPVTVGMRRSVHVLLFDEGLCGPRAGGLGGFGPGGGERLRLLASVAIDGDGFEAELPGLKVGFGDFVDRCRLGQVDCL